ncbi:MAG TPA: tetratricopeptide repeat protein [Candidatus Eisenbacteria bacterium]
MRAMAGVGLAALLTAALAAAGCGGVGTMATRYSAEKRYWNAQRDEQKARLAARPDSTTLLRLREGYRGVRSSVSLPPQPAASGPAAIEYRGLFRTLANAEMQAARLALEARRPDLALEDAQWILGHAGTDTTAARQADFIVVGCYRTVGRYDDAIAAIHEMLKKYPPQPAEKPGGEDAILSLPNAPVEIRRQLGDADGMKREEAAAVEYYRGLLQRPQPLELEARIRARYVRALLAQGDAPASLREAQALEDLVGRHAELKSFEPDVHYVNAKVHAVTDKDHTAAISLLERVATDYPTANVAGPALFESAALLEDQKKFDLAKQRYKDAAARYPGNLDVAPVSLYRQAMLEDRTGNWPIAKAILEALPLKYPGTQASAEAPLAIAQRYARVGDRAAMNVALQKAVEVYRTLAARDSSGAAGAVYRWNILKCQLNLQDWQGALQAVDELVAHNPGHPFTAQALLEGAKVAQAQKLVDRAAGYLQRFLQDYPNSPAAAKVREDLKGLGG